MFNSKFMYGVIRNDGGTKENLIKERAAQIRAEELYEKAERRKESLQRRQDNIHDKKIYELGYQRGMIKAYRNLKYGYSDIALMMGIPESSVRSLASSRSKSVEE